MKKFGKRMLLVLIYPVALPIRLLGAVRELWEDVCEMWENPDDWTVF